MATHSSSLVRVQSLRVEFEEMSILSLHLFFEILDSVSTLRESTDHCGQAQENARRVPRKKTQLSLLISPTSGSYRLSTRQGLRSTSAITEDRSTRERERNHEMSTIPDPISSNPSTAASTPFKRRKSSVISVSTVPLIEDVNQPSVFILLPFALTSYTGERLVKQSEEHLVVSFSTQYTHPTPPTLGPETADKVTIRILHEGGPTIPQLPHGWILERAIDNSDLRSRVKRLGEAVERWKQSRKEGGPKRSATSECTLAVRYQAGWVDGVCIETLSGKQLSRVEFYHTELNVSSKKAKVVSSSIGLFGLRSLLNARYRLKPSDRHFQPHPLSAFRLPTTTMTCLQSHRGRR